MSKLNVSIIGAGSSYTPELLEGLYHYRDQLPVTKLTLMDIDGKRLEVVGNFCKRYAKHLGLHIDIRLTTDRRQAIEDASFINTQIRVGGVAARIQDEKIPLKYGLIGQETTGAGGFMKGLRSIPVMLEIARDVERYNPDAWIINYTNPTGLITEAVTKYSNVKIAGLCSGGTFPQIWVSKALGVDRSSVRYNYAGLNHMNFAFDITIDGRLITDEQFDRTADHVWNVDPEIVRTLRALPSPYLQYFYHTAKRVEAMVTNGTRGEEVSALETETYTAFADPNQHEKPQVLSKRGGGGYSEVAIGLMNSIYNNEDRWYVVNVPNRGALPNLPDDAVIEAGCLVNRSGIHPLSIGKVPAPVWGLIASVKNYEQLAVEAAVHGDKNLALQALLAHPLVREYDIAKPLLEELLAANQAFLPWA
jgi:6-phospho-beta-glucosidase